MYYSTELVFVVRTNNILHPRNPVFHEGCNIIFHKIAVFSTLMFISRVVSEALFVLGTSLKRVKIRDQFGTFSVFDNTN